MKKLLTVLQNGFYKYMPIEKGMLLSFIIIALSLNLLHSEHSWAQKSFVVNKQDCSALTNDNLQNNGLLDAYRPDQEIILKRDRTSKHFQNTDGSINAIITAGTSLHYKDESGLWNDVITEISPSKDPIYSYENTTNTIKSYFPTEHLDVNGIRIGEANGSMVISKNQAIVWFNHDNEITILEKGQNVTGSVVGKKIVYKNSFVTGDIEYEIDNDMVKHSIVLNSMPTYLNNLEGYVGFSENIELPAGWSLYSDDKKIDEAKTLEGYISVKDESGNLIYTFPVPEVFEAGNPAVSLLNPDGTSNTGKTYYVIPQNGEYQIISLVPVDWLKARTFPIVIDPTTTIYATSGGWLYPSSYSNDVNIMICGYWSSGSAIQRAWGKFNTSTITDGSTISSVTLRLYCDLAVSTTNVTISTWSIETYYGPYGAYNLDYYNDIGNGTNYNTYTVGSEGYYGPTSLGVTAASHLQAQLANDRFQVGLTSSNTSGSDLRKRFTSNSYIVVTYESCAPPTTVTAYANGSTAATICNGSSVTLTAGTYSGGSCTGNWEYHWRIGGTTVRDWSTTETYTPSPSSTTTYTLDMRCSACSGTYTSDDVTVAVNQPPSGTATPAANYVGLGLSTTISVSGSYSSIVRWERRINGGAWSNISSTANSINTGIMNPEGTWEYRALLKRDPCSDVYSSIATVQVNYPIVHNYGTAGYPNACAQAAGGWTGYVCFWTGAINNNWSEAGNWIRWLATSAGGNPYTYTNQIPQTGDYVEISRNVALVRTECIVNVNTNTVSHLVVMAGTKLTVNSTLNIGNTTGENWETALHVHSGGEIELSNGSGVINLDNGSTTTGTGGSGGTGGLGYCFTVNGTFTMSAGNAYVDDDMIVTGTVTQSGGNIYLGYHPSTGAKSYDGALYVSGADYAAYNHSAGNLYVGRRFYTSGGYGSYESGKGYYRGSGTSTVTVGAYSGSTEPQIIVSDNANNSYLNNLVISGNIVLYTQPSIPLIINGLFTINTGSSLNTQSNSMIIGGNWNNNGTFTPGTGTVTFNGTTAISGSTASHNFYNITINSGKSLTAPDGNLNVAGNWTNNGTFTAGNGTVVFNGNAPQTITSGSSSFNNIIFNSTGIGNADIVLADDLHVEGQASFSDGIVNTGSNKLVFGTSASTNAGTASSFVDGKVEKTNCTGLFTLPTGNVVSRDLGSGTQTYIMWAPIGLNPASPATVNARYLFSNEGLHEWWYHAWTHEFPLTHTSAREYWLVNATQPLTATIHWKNNNPCYVHDFCTDGTNDFLPAHLTLAYWDGIWKDGASSNSPNGDYQNGYIQSSVQIPFGAKGDVQITFGAKDEELPLPVELISFTATCENNTAFISWQTASETNNDYFIIEKSNDMVNFFELARIEGAGNSNTLLSYSIVDNELFSGDNYYRLKQVDYDGRSRTYNYISINCDKSSSDIPSLMAYPNPFTNELNVVIENLHESEFVLELYDNIGKLIFSHEYSTKETRFHTVLDLDNLLPAVYNLRSRSEGNVMNVKVVKK